MLDALVPWLPFVPALSGRGPRESGRPQNERRENERDEACENATHLHPSKADSATCCEYEVEASSGQSRGSWHVDRAVDAQDAVRAIDASRVPYAIPMIPPCAGPTLSCVLVVERRALHRALAVVGIASALLLVGVVLHGVVVSS